MKGSRQRPCRRPLRGVLSENGSGLPEGSVAGNARPTGTVVGMVYGPIDGICLRRSGIARRGWLGVAGMHDGGQCPTGV